jgi:hypothetical protein
VQLKIIISPAGKAGQTRLSSPDSPPLPAYRQAGKQYSFVIINCKKKNQGITEQK